MKSATDVVHDLINAAVVDAIVALRGASAGVPNAILRDLNAIHANTAFSDLPVAVQTAVGASVRAAFAELRKEGYVIADAKTVQPAGATPTRSSAPHTPRPSPGRGRGPAPTRRPPKPR